ncbi:MAG TPA: PKD domain-containing protein [Thermoplasmata archaeon]|nr:PKD domain-containing protein [Thermoplasmata archaeon]
MRSTSYGHSVAEVSALGVAVTANPGAGAAPLLVQLVATVSPAGPYALSWSFGDGSYWNGTTPALDRVSHWFALPGSYRVEARVANTTANATGTATVVVGPNPLRAFISARPGSGTAPVNATFTVTPSGGSGTYREFLWSFGDGENGSGLVVAHEYLGPGQYVVTVQVVDSANASAQARLEFNVTDAASRPSGDGGPPPALEAIYAAAIAGAGVAVGVVTWRGRRDRASGPAGAAASPEAEGPGAIGIAADSIRAPDPVSAGAVPLSVQVDGAPTTIPPPGVGMSPITPRASMATELELPSEPPRSPREVSHELLVYLLQLGAIGPEDVPDRRRTQAGLSEALGLSQSTVSSLLRRLRAARAVAVETRHVQGANRRLRVYVLTPRGDQVARSLRTRGVRVSRPAPAPRPRSSDQDD